MIRFSSPAMAASRAIAPLLAFLVALTPLAAQSVDPSSTRHQAMAPNASGRDGWSAEVKSKAIVQYDDNVFLLSPGQRTALASPSAGSVVSGRYEGMESANDVIGVSNVGIRLSGPGVRGRNLEITPELSYEFASRNQLRREATGALSIVHSLGGGRRIQLTGSAAPRHFSRNYLSDAVDADANGSISSNERIYKRGQYGEYTIAGDFLVPLGSKSSRAGAVLGAAAGYYTRSYNSPFAVRDVSGPTATVSLAFGQKSPVGLELTYDLAALSGAPSKQVALLDEPVYNVDFNGNGTTADLNARALVDMDRSRLEHQISGVLTFDTGRRATASLGYDYRIRSFQSALPYDESDAGRRDNRSGIRGSLRAKMAKGVYMSTGVKFLSQRTNRPLGSTLGEEADYRNIVASVGLQASF